jgi:hypothetical protein
VACPLCNIFPHYLINGTIFGKRYWTQNTCFDFLYKFFRKLSHSKRNWARYLVVFTWSTRYSCPILMKLNFLDSVSKNTQISNFMKTCPVGVGLFHTEDGRKARHDETNIRFSKFCERSLKCCLVGSLYLTYIVVLRTWRETNTGKNFGFVLPLFGIQLQVLRSTLEYVKCYY